MGITARWSASLFRNVTAPSLRINCQFNTLLLKGNHGEARLVINALQLALAILLLGAAIWIGDVIAGGIDSALGEKKMRDRDA
jgi:hypothetical protein